MTHREKNVHPMPETDRRHFVGVAGLLALGLGLSGCAYYPVEPGPAVGMVGGGPVYVQPQPVVRYVQPTPVYVAPQPVLIQREVVRPLPMPHVREERRFVEPARMERRETHLQEPHGERREVQTPRKASELQRCRPGQDDCQRR